MYHDTFPALFTNGARINLSIRLLTVTVKVMIRAHTHCGWPTRFDYVKSVPWKFEKKKQRRTEGDNVTCGQTTTKTSKMFSMCTSGMYGTATICSMFILFRIWTFPYRKFVKLWNCLHISLRFCDSGAPSEIKHFLSASQSSNDSFVLCNVNAEYWCSTDISGFSNIMCTQVHT